MAELLWGQRQVEAVVPAHVGADAAALAPPLVAVGGQAAGAQKRCIMLASVLCLDGGSGVVYLAWMF